MTTLATTRCYHHQAREAVARCPECARYFCRECVSDYEGKALCAQCLSTMITGGRRTIKSLWASLRIALALSGVTLAWFLFYTLGTLLMRIPAEFHQGWRQP
jgi:hypothetical protein